MNSSSAVATKATAPPAPRAVAEPSPALLDLRADIASCEARIERLATTWHLHNVYEDRTNARADLDTLTHYVARRRKDITAMEQAEQQQAARVDQLTAMATATGQPAGVALAHLVAGTRTVRVVAVGSIRAGVIRMHAPRMSDDLWTALFQHRPTACQTHRVWADQCAAQHGLTAVA